MARTRPAAKTRVSKSSERSASDRAREPIDNSTERQASTDHTQRLVELARQTHRNIDEALAEFRSVWLSCCEPTATAADANTKAFIELRFFDREGQASDNAGVANYDIPETHDDQDTHDKRRRKPGDWARLRQLLEKGLRDGMGVKAKSNTNQLARRGPWKIALLELYVVFRRGACTSERFTAELRHLAACMPSFEQALAQLSQAREIRQGTSQTRQDTTTQPRHKSGTSIGREWQPWDIQHVLQECERNGLCNKGGTKAKTNGKTTRAEHGEDTDKPGQEASTGAPGSQPPSHDDGFSIDNNGTQPEQELDDVSSTDIEHGRRLERERELPPNDSIFGDDDGFFFPPDSPTASISTASRAHQSPLLQPAGPQLPSMPPLPKRRRGNDSPPPATRQPLRLPVFGDWFAVLSSSRIPFAITSTDTDAAPNDTINPLHIDLNEHALRVATNQHGTHPADCQYYIPAKVAAPHLNSLWLLIVTSDNADNAVCYHPSDLSADDCKHITSVISGLLLQQGTGVPDLTNLALHTQVLPQIEHADDELDGKDVQTTVQVAATMLHLVAGGKLPPLLDIRIWQRVLSCCCELQVSGLSSDVAPLPQFALPAAPDGGNSSESEDADVLQMAFEKSKAKLDKYEARAKLHEVMAEATADIRQCVVQVLALAKNERAWVAATCAQNPDFEKLEYAAKLLASTFGNAAFSASVQEQMSKLPAVGTHADLAAADKRIDLLTQMRNILGNDCEEYRQWAREGREASVDLLQDLVEQTRSILDALTKRQQGTNYEMGK